jgi:hypothetical protein
VTSGAETGGIDFGLELRNSAPAAPGNLQASGSGFTVTFRWSAPTTMFASAATSFLLEAGLSPGTTLVSMPVSATSITIPNVPPGTFYVRVRGVNAFGAGPPTPDYVLRVGADGLVPLEAPTNIVAFTNGGRLTLTWAAPAAGGPPTGYLVEAGTATGAANIATLPVNGRSFTFSPVPDGFYFLRVRARTATQVGPPSAEAMIVVGNVDSPPGPPSFNSPTVSGSTVTLNWTTPAVGGATRYVIEAGSAPGRSDLAVVDTGGPSLTRVVTNVPSGIYYVRVRAVNALGAGVVSNERMIRVGS